MSSETPDMPDDPQVARAAAEPAASHAPASPPPLPAPAQAPPALPPGYAVVRRDPKSPLAALLLSVLFPSLGQVYNGQLAKALIIFGIWASALYTMIEVHPIPWVFVMAFTTLFSYVDAWRSATLINARATGSELSELEDVADSPLWGGVLLLVGVLLLLNNLGWVSLRELHRFWPVLLIAAGAGTLWTSLKRRKAQEGGGETGSQD